jgi:hypothetical protein
MLGPDGRRPEFLSIPVDIDRVEKPVLGGASLVYGAIDSTSSQNLVANLQPATATGTMTLG